MTFAAHSLLPGSYTFEVTVTRESDGSSGVANISVEVVAAAQPVFAMPMPALVDRSTRKIRVNYTLEKPFMYDALLEESNSEGCAAPSQYAWWASHGAPLQPLLF